MHESVVVADGHADVRASAAMTDDTDDDADDGDCDGNRGAILGALSMPTHSLDLDHDLAFGAIDSNVDLTSPTLSPPLPYHPSSAATGEPF